MGQSDETARYLRRRRGIRRAACSLLALSLAVSLLDQLGVFGATIHERDRLNRSTWTVSRIIDAGSFELRNDDRSITFKLIGIDAPIGDAFWSDRAASYAAARALHKSVTLVFDIAQTRDASGSLCGFLYLSDVETLNLALVRDGQAFVDRRVHQTYSSAFEQAENAARKKGTGLWKSLRFEDMPAWRRVWLREIGERRKRDAESKMRAE